MSVHILKNGRQYRITATPSDPEHYICNSIILGNDIVDIRDIYRRLESMYYHGTDFVVNSTTGVGTMSFTMNPNINNIDATFEEVSRCKTPLYIDVPNELHIGTAYQHTSHLLCSTDNVNWSRWPYYEDEFNWDLLNDYPDNPLNNGYDYGIEYETWLWENSPHVVLPAGRYYFKSMNDFHSFSVLNDFFFLGIYPMFNDKYSMGGNLTSYCSKYFDTLLYNIGVISLAPYLNCTDMSKLVIYPSIDPIVYDNFNVLQLNSFIRGLFIGNSSIEHPDIEHSPIIMDSPFFKIEPYNEVTYSGQIHTLFDGCSNLKSITCLLDPQSINNNDETNSSTLWGSVGPTGIFYKKPGTTWTSDLVPPGWTIQDFDMSQLSQI